MNSKITKPFTSVLLALSLLLTFNTAVESQVNQTTVNSPEIERTDAYAKQLEDYLRNYLVDNYDDRASKCWNRDYSSVDAFLRSVETNRQRWESTMVKPPVFRKTGPLTRKPFLVEGIEAEWITLPLGMLTAEAILAFPQGNAGQKPLPLVIVQHGIGSTPETPFRGGSYNYYAIELLKAGFAVLVPMNLQSVERRNRIERLCRLANISLPGIELERVRHLLDVVLTEPGIDPERVGMWGVSLGGMATMFWMPLEPRIKAGVVSAWFNHRRNKMVIPDDRYSCFLVTREEHAFFNGWLTEFSDHDLVSLICPRPLLIQHGKKDAIAYWPQVISEFDIAKTHYEKLHIADRIQLNVHEGGHEAIIKSGVEFMNRWLKISK